MARKKHRSRAPEIQIDDLHPIADGFVHAYQGTATGQGVRAVAYLDLVERGNFPAGLYQPGAYELTCSYERLAKKGRMDPERLREIGHRLLTHLRERMLVEMCEAGWRRVGKTKEGRDIWQHRPRSSPS